MSVTSCRVVVGKWRLASLPHTAHTVPTPTSVVLSTVALMLGAIQPTDCHRQRVHNVPTVHQLATNEYRTPFRLIHAWFTPWYTPEWWRRSHL